MQPPFSSVNSAPDRPASSRIQFVIFLSTWRSETGPMDTNRRQVLKTGSGAAVLTLLAAAGLLNPGSAAASWNKSAFETHSLDDAMKAMGGSMPAQSADVTFFSTA